LIDRLMRRKRPRKLVENVSKRKLENEKSKVYGSGSVGTAVADLMTVVADAEVVNLDAVGFGAPALLDVAHSIIAARHLVVRWTPTSPQVVEAGGATGMTDLSGIVRRKTAHCQYPSLAHAPARALVLPRPIYAAEEATRSQDLEGIGLDHGPESILDVSPVLEAEGEGFQVVVIREHAPFLLLKRLAHVHLEDPGGNDPPHSHPAAALRLLFLGTIVAVGENTIDVGVYPDHDQDLILWSRIADTLEKHILKAVWEGGGLHPSTVLVTRMIHALMFERHQSMTLATAAGAEHPTVATGNTGVTNLEAGVVVGV
jgi:hypothetical protein